MIENTIIGAAFEPAEKLRSMVNGPGSDEPRDFDVVRGFKIRAANTQGRRSSASILIQRRYAWRGYQTAPLPNDPSMERITLVASDNETTIGTMSVGFDGASGLMVEELFPQEVQAMRDAGHRVCEFTKLAMETTVSTNSRRVLASLFHVAYIYAYRVMKFDRLLIEVNPRHVKYYERILGFVSSGVERLNTRVNAPAVLMALDFSHTQSQIGLFGGRPQLAATERSLYPYSFSVDEEAAVAARMAGNLARAMQG